MLVCFWKHDIIPHMAQNLRLGGPGNIKKLNDTLHTSFVKHESYHNIQYINNQAIYPLPTHLLRDFELLGKLITRLIHATDKNKEEN